ncbi:amino acid deaminase [Aestuariibacter sp. A3R04]|uniref:amino acid deaminase n=1 Tax=Aestuariibacter sp. A3R04 TaxID=2841571 RepID=UPI001C088D6D|nr:amino acid deaminase [Aestuariibacter sp. A3R04]MBU3021346.1 amino acid deaminase [Aestuariibacter sp. A3R04]
MLNLPVKVEPNDIVEKGTGCPETYQSSGWNLLAEDISFPAAVIHARALENNARWMQTFSEKAKVKLAPHGKTTMSPELFHLQMQQGCWGMSLATVPQVVTAYHSGIKRIILANQLVGRRHYEIIADLLKKGGLEFYCFVDSIENAKSLGAFFSAKNIRLNILLEIGVVGGRCGWRDTHNIMKLCDVINQYDALQLCGISFYEGVIHGENAEREIIAFVKLITRLCEHLYEKRVFSTDDIIVTGAGSAWYDLVSQHLHSHYRQIEFTPIIRPGCYLIHDTGIYQDAQRAVLERSELACQLSLEEAGQLESSLSLWAYVQSVPEPGLVIVGMGKRDVAFDAGLPTPELHFRPGMPAPVKSAAEWKVTKIMDQHCMMSTSAEADLKPGDLLSFSTSHPCLTMDKWRFIGVMDDNYMIRQHITTYF